MAIGQLARQMAKVKRRKVEDNRRKIRLIEGKAKCWHLRKGLQKDFEAGIYHPEAQNSKPQHLTH